MVNLDFFVKKSHSVRVLSIGGSVRFWSFLLLVIGWNSFSFAFSEGPAHYLSEDEKFYVDTFDFSGNFPDTETIEIHAQRKKRVHFDVSGQFPKLETISYQGAFGLLRAKLTGEYPELSLLTMSCTSCKMDLDFRGNWKKNVTVQISNESEPITVILPKEVGVIVHTQVSMKGQVITSSELTQKGRGIWRKTFQNSLVREAPVTLTFHINSSNGGTIILR